MLADCALAGGGNASQGGSKMSEKGPAILSTKFVELTIAGGAVFWVTTIAASLLPMAAEYRAAFANRTWSAQTVWVASLPAGMIVASCVSYCLLRFVARIPTQNPMAKSTMLSLIALVIAIVLIDIPQSALLLRPGDALHYFLIGTMLNAPRFLFLGITIGYMYNRLYRAA
jgi:hypothetical protein